MPRFGCKPQCDCKDEAERAELRQARDAEGPFGVQQPCDTEHGVDAKPEPAHHPRIELLTPRT